MVQHDNEHPEDMGALMLKLMRDNGLKPYVRPKMPLKEGAWKTGTATTVAHLLNMLSFISVVNSGYQVTRKLSIALCFNAEMSFRWVPRFVAFRGSTWLLLSWLGVTFSVSRFDLDGIADNYALLRVVLHEQVYPAAADFGVFQEQHQREHAHHLSPFSPKPTDTLN